MNSVTTSRDFFRRTSSLTIQVVLTRILSLVYVFFLARWFDAIQRTQVTFLLMVLTIASTLLLLSLPTFLSVDIPQARIEGRTETIRKDFEYISLISLGTSFIGSVISLLFAGFILLWLTISPTLEILFLFIIVIVTLIPYNLLSVTTKMLLGLNRVEKMAIINGTNAFLTYVIALVLIFPVPQLNFGPLGVILAWLIASISALGLSIYYLRDVFTLPRIRHHSFATIFRFSAPLWVTGLFITVNPWIDNFFVLSTLGAALGNYYYSIRLVQIIVALLSSIAVTFLPVISEARGIGAERMRIVYNTTMKFTIYIAAIITASMLVFSQTILLAILGIDFLDSLLAFQILSFSVFTQAIVGLLASLFAAANRTIVTLYASIAQFVTAIVVGIMLVPSAALISPIIGMAGAAFTALIGYSMNFAVFYFFLRRETTFRIQKHTLIISIFAALITGIFMWVLSTLSTLPTQLYLTNVISMFISHALPLLVPWVDAIVGVLVLLVNLLIFAFGIFLFMVLLLALKGFDSADFAVARRALPKWFERLIALLEKLHQRLHKTD